jgi:hypothetical protein
MGNSIAIDLNWELRSICQIFHIPFGGILEDLPSECWSSLYSRWILRPFGRSAFPLRSNLHDDRCHISRPAGNESFLAFKSMNEPIYDQWIPESIRRSMSEWISKSVKSANNWIIESSDNGILDSSNNQIIQYVQKFHQLSTALR